MKMARLSDYDFEMAKEICEQVSCGQNIKSVLDSKKEYPSFPTWCKWKRENAELLNLYVNSIQDKAEMVDVKIDEIWEGCRVGLYDASTANVLIQTLKWKAGKYYPKMFGDSQRIESENVNKNINVINLGDGE